VVYAEVFKLLLNACFGKMAQNNANHLKLTVTTSQEKAELLVSRPRFRSLEEYELDGETVFWMEQEQDTISHNMPIQGACTIFSNAKLRMLEFVYDFVDRFIPRDDYQVMYTDTDSMWIAFTKTNPFGLPNPEDMPATPDQVVPRPRSSLCRPSLREEFEYEKANYMVLNKYDERTPGLFKTEYEARELACVGAKSYYALRLRYEGEDENDQSGWMWPGVKKGAKGIQERNELSMELHKRAVFDEDFEKEVTNRGFRYFPQEGLQLYEQVKRGVNGVYDKRIVLPNHVNTRPRQWNE